MWLKLGAVLCICSFVRGIIFINWFCFIVPLYIFSPQHETSVPNPAHAVHTDTDLPAVFRDYQLPQNHHQPPPQAMFPTNQSTASFSTLQAPNPAAGQSQYTFHELRPEGGASEDTMTDEDL